MLQQQCVKD